ncbi:MULTISPECIES: cache domain-containing protein [Vibrio]|nr:MULTISPECIES: cache domain-containing protein [Vibrio]
MMENKPKIILVISTLFLVLMNINIVFAKNNNIEAINVLNTTLPYSESPREIRVKVLLTKAVDHIKNQGVEAVVDFSKQEKFIDKDLYVFALNTSGTFLASGGASVSLVGSNVTNTLDTHGKPFFQQMIDTAANDKVNAIEYYWTNPVERGGEPKRTFYTRVDNIIIAVGYNPARSTQVEAEALLDKAMRSMVVNESESLKAFNDHKGQFVQGDLYVFVLDINTGEFLAHGVAIELVGKLASEVLEPDNESTLAMLLQQAKEKGRGEYRYRWVNPTSGKVETKSTLYRVLDNKVIAVGYYTRQINSF